MAFGDFSLKDIETAFQVTLVESEDLFTAVPDAEASPLLHELLRVYLPLALAINTEKGRSELLIAPTLVEVREQLKHRVSLFSGVDFNVDPERGLNGVCDFILAQSPQQQYVRAPIVTIVEAKNENLKSGFGQCVAAMIAARLFNERDGTPLPAIYGVVTTGTLWRFLKLVNNSVQLDQHEYHIERVGKILGILLAITRAD